MKTIKMLLPTILIILLEIAIGILLIINAEKLTVAVFTLFGIALLVLAVVMLFRYLKERKDDGGNMLTLITAIIAFVIGLVLAFGASMIVNAGTALFAIFYGAVMIVNGFLKISEYITLKKEGAAVSAVRIFNGLISIALGVVAIIFNGWAIDVIGLIIGITLLVEAVLDIAALVIARRMDTRMISIYDTSGDDSDYDLE